MRLSKEIIAKIIDWYEEYEDSDYPNNISVEQGISNRLGYITSEPIDEKNLMNLLQIGI